MKIINYVKGIACFLIMVFSLVKVAAQYPQGYFRNPLGIPIQLSTNFGEIRPNHFHMGLDIRTQGRENLPVYAAGDGYVSRVKIEKWGYGRAIYITHPNGYTTVYGHLNDFFTELDNLLKKQQYSTESWEQDLRFRPDQFPVKKGQFIAFSGNTGGSAGPHLHFEIRNTKTNNCHNPELFNFNIPDNVPPVIYNLYWYDRRFSTYQIGPKNIPVVKKAGGYTTAAGIVKVGSPIISFGIKAEDKSSNSPFMFGIYAASISVDGILQNSFALDNFSYDDSRYVNACIDYTNYIQTKGKGIQHLSKLPGNLLRVFNPVDGEGIVMLPDTLPHKISIKVKDVYDNTTSLNFTVQLSSSLQHQYTPPANVRPVIVNKENIITGNNVKAVFGKTEFYDNVPFVLTEKNSVSKNSASPLIQLHNGSVPVDDSFAIQIKTTLKPNDPLRNKVVIFKLTGTHKEAMKGKWSGDWMQGKFNRLGDFQLLVDIVPPVVTPVGWKNGEAFLSQKRLVLKCKDELDEIDNFRATLDGKWLMFGKKNDDFIYTFDEHCPIGPHTLTVMATDKAGNVTTKQFTFVKK